MKRLYFYLILLFFLASSCKDIGNESINAKILYLPEYNSITDTLFKILDDYRKYLNTPREIVFQVFVDQNPDSITIYLTYIQYYAQLDKYSPTGYFKIEEDFFLVYSGVNILFSTDTVFLRNLQYEISLIDLKEENEIPILFRNHPWTITYFQQNKKLIVNKRAVCPYTTWEHVIN